MATTGKVVQVIGSTFDAHEGVDGGGTGGVVGKKMEVFKISVRNTVDGVGSKARGIATTTEGIMGEAAPVLSKYAPYIGMAMTAVKVIQTINQVRGALGARKRK
jgi:hypothetical protein